VTADAEVVLRAFRESDRGAVVDLWRRCDLVRPWNDPDRDIDRKAADSPDGFFVAELGGVVVAAMLVGYDGHRGWINYLAVEPSLRGNGLGRRMVEHAESWLLAQGCPKLNLQVRAANTDVLAFYEALGYQVDAAVSLGKRLIHDA
jgi:ribosomal protein S18 acetylase RimI-like enzyme